MRIRNVLVTIALLAPAALAQGAGHRARPNVMILVLDDVALSDADRIPTPNIDWLASQGVSFRRGYASPICNPTRYSIVFGRYLREPTGRPCRDGEGVPYHGTFSLPKMMKGRGYATGLFGKWHVGSNIIGRWEITPQLHGFDVWRAGSPSNLQLCTGTGYEDWLRVDDGHSEITTEYQTIAVRDATLDWWQSTDGPKLAYVCFQAPHVPLHVPPAELLPAGYPAPSTAREKYEAMVVSADTAIGQILDVIDLRTTWVFVIGDNGTPPEALRPDQTTNHVKLSVFEDGVRVPFVVAGPELRHSFESEALIHTVDLMATIADLVGAEIPPGVPRESVSFARCLAAPGAKVRKWVFCDNQLPPTGMGQGTPGDDPGRQRALITTRFKLRRLGEDVEELYDLEADPREVAPIDPDDPALGPELTHAVRWLRRELDAVE